MADRGNDNIACPVMQNKRLGFRQKWDENNWLWKDGEYIIISMVIAKEPEQRGHSLVLPAHHWKLGYVKVPTRLSLDATIVKAHGFQRKRA